MSLLPYQKNRTTGDKDLDSFAEGGLKTNRCEDFRMKTVKCDCERFGNNSVISQEEYLEELQGRGCCALGLISMLMKKP